MGPTHALSALAFALMLTWLASDFMLKNIIGSTNVVVFITAIIIIIGSSLSPDFDAVKSTSINTLGIIGIMLSKIMRAFSSMVQSLIKGPYDKDSDPHRGFWHTFIAAGLVGLMVSAITNINIKIFIVNNITLTVATLSVIFIVYISIQLVLASLFKGFYKKTKNKFIGGLIMSGVSMLSTVMLVFSLPADLSYSWVGAAVTFGWITHLLGDMLTVSGVPILFPIKFKGKRWWNFRFPLGIKAGGYIEKTLLIPVFIIIIIFSLFKVIPILN